MRLFCIFSILICLALGCSRPQEVSKVTLASATTNLLRYELKSGASSCRIYASSDLQAYEADNLVVDIYVKNICETELRGSMGIKPDGRPGYFKVPIGKAKLIYSGRPKVFYENPLSLHGGPLRQFDFELQVRFNTNLVFASPWLLEVEKVELMP